MTKKSDEQTICQSIKQKGVDSFSNDHELDKEATITTNTNINDKNLDDFEMTDWRW